MRQWLPARLEELAGADWQEDGEPVIEVEKEWAEQQYADEPKGEPAVVFDRRWTLTVLEYAMRGLRAEYAARGLEKLFAEASPFVGFEGADEEHYTEAAQRMSMTLGAMRRAIFELRTQHHDLLRTIVADTVVDPAEVDGEITALLCACDPQVEPGEHAAPLPTAIRTFKPDELLARAMNSVHMTGGGFGGNWAPPSDAEAARLFPQYEICGLVGRGAMGAVFRARQVALDREVAIKLLPLEVSVDRDFADRFVREARAMAKLSHPNIISVYNFGTTDEGHLFFVMEYVEGADLLQLIRNDELTPAKAVAVAGQVCTALAYAHGKGVIHRDIKPANVMVNSEGVAKVADFGLARLNDANVDQYGQTVTGTIMGTEEYMAPEQKRGMAVDHRADIFSMGVMLYEMICKEPPQGAFEPLSERVGCDARIDEIVLKAMNRTPEDRFQSATDMKIALDASCAPLPASRQLRQRSPTTNIVVNRPYQEAPPEKSPVGKSVAITLAVVLAIGAAIFFPGGQKKPAAKSVAPVAAKKETATPETVSKPAPANPSESKKTADKAADGTATAKPENAPAPAPPANPTANVAVKSAMEQWLADVDGPQQESFQKQVAMPFATGMEELRKSYVAALDAGQAKASATGKLDQAIIWNDERKAFEETGLVGPDDDSTPAPLLPLRAAFRTKLAKLESERAGRAKTLVAGYDSILAKNFVLLTERGRTRDALLLKNKREEIARVWLEKPGEGLVKPFATKDRPFVNTLGMKFVPVPIIGGPNGGQRVLFSVWETRRQDYEAFATETGRKWEKGKDPLHPVAGSQWDEAQAFCMWLTEVERKAGKLAANETYRLPTDHEWSCAVGIGEQEDAAKAPNEKDGKIPDTYPWGSAWPPPAGAENYSGKEMEPALAAGKYNWVKGFISDYQDGFVVTAPVGSFAVNRFGLYDLGGNLFEWCEDWYDSTQTARTVRGGCWETDSAASALSARRKRVVPTVVWASLGFRVVLAATSASVPASGEGYGPWEDLLAQLTPAVVEQTGHGWRMESGTLVSPAKSFATLPLPGSFAGTSYQIHVKLWRLTTEEVFHVVLPVGDHMTGFELDGWGSTATGLNAVTDQQTVKGRQVKDSEPHDLEVTVRLDGANAKITATLDARPLYAWSGPITALSQVGLWATTSAGSLALGTTAASWVVSEVKARRLKNPGTRADTGANRLSPPKIDTTGWTDLFAQLTPDLLEQTGQGWRIEAGTLSAPKAERAMLPLPGTFSGTSYQLRVKLRQVTVGHGFHLILPVGDHMTMLDLDGFEGQYTGLSTADGKAGKDLPGVVEGRQVKDSEPHDLEVIVRLNGANARITTTLDARPLYEWTGPIASLSRSAQWDSSPLGCLAVGTSTDNWAVSEVKVKRLDDPGKLADAGAYRLPAPKVDAKGWADLLATLTPALVEKTGHGWRMKGGALHSPSVKFATLPLAGGFAGTSYQVRVRLRRLAAKDIFLVALPVGERMVGFYVDGNPAQGFDTALACVNGKFGKDVPGFVPGKQVKDSLPHDLAVSVRLDGANAKITSTLDTRPLFEWTGPISSLGLNTAWDGTPPAIIALGTVCDDWVVSEVKAKRLDWK
jgi:serine/threonine protein kinase